MRLIIAYPSLLASGVVKRWMMAQEFHQSPIAGSTHWWFDNYPDLAN
jgi:hypothetical protein